MRKNKIVIRNNTVYEMGKSGKPKHIIHGVSNYFKMRNGEEPYDEYIENNDDDDHPHGITNIRRMEILKVMGNKKKLVSKADGLDREIPVDERRKKKHKPKSKRGKRGKKK
jgi:hypothetical protein